MSPARNDIVDLIYNASQAVTKYPSSSAQVKISSNKITVEQLCSLGNLFAPEIGYTVRQEDTNLVIDLFKVLSIKPKAIIKNALPYKWTPKYFEPLPPYYEMVPRSTIDR